MSATRNSIVYHIYVFIVNRLIKNSRVKSAGGSGPVLRNLIALECVASHQWGFIYVGCKRKRVSQQLFGCINIFAVFCFALLNMLIFLE